MNKDGYQNFKHKCHQFDQFGMDYRRAKIFTSKAYTNYIGLNRIMEDPNHYLMDSKESVSYFENIKKVFELVLENLPSDLSIILKNDYFEVKESNWWIFYYSRSTYYRLKNKAMDQFLAILYVK